ncbi:MAG: mechanosensitive ion channel [Gammaproteobacteria bacterium]|nr:mechanosensitive ion channel [Gammaproteobacteria bacterium]
MYKPSINYIVTCVFMLFSVYSSVAFSYDEILFEKNINELNEVKSLLAKKKYKSEDLTNWTILAINLRSTAELCVSEKEEILAALKESISGLGEVTEGEDISITSVRDLLSEDKNRVENELAECNVQLLSIDETEELLDIAKSSDLERVYFSKQQNLVELLVDFVNNPAELFSDSTEFIIDRSGIQSIKLFEWFTGLAIIIVVLVFSLRLRKFLNKQSAATDWNNDLDRLILHSTITVCARYLPYVLFFISSYLFLSYITLNIEHDLFITQFSLAVSIYFVFIIVTNLFLSPLPPAKPIIENMGNILVKLSQRLKVLFLIALMGYLAFYTVFSNSMSETNLHLLRYVFSLFLVINLVWTIRVLIDPKKLPKLSWVARGVNLVLLLTLISEWLGYINLSLAVRGGVLITFVLLILFFGITTIFKLVFNSLDKGSNKLSRHIRTKLGVEGENVIPGLIWIRLLFSVLLWGAFLLLLVNIWDYNGGLLTQLKNYIINGFTLGDYRVVPSKVLWAVFVFSGLLVISGWIKCQLEKHWLAMINLDSGARDAVVTIAGYVMFLSSILIGLSVAGFNFGNIAIVAGALSVGIGFGLQNIVNNFVSGLILLFERPIRKGDWVEVGTTAGYVQNIQIRSTLIRTFDNSDVIVPNSELISNQVTNWMLSSKRGRAIIPVGVAYGSDIEQVKEILLKIADENENLIHGVSQWAPKVLFRAFGASSLDFELRVFLKEVSGRLGVISDINFAIDKAFREANVEIPFPQSDVHIRTLPDKDE